MPTVPPRYARIKSLSAAIVTVTVAMAAGVIVHGGWQLGNGHVTIGLLCILAALTAALLGLLGHFSLLLNLKSANNSFRVYGAILDLVEVSRRQTDYAHTVAENSALSDWAKRLVYREKDFDLLRDMVLSAVVREDWELADSLIEQLSEHIGHKTEAEQLRQEVEQARQATTDERVQKAVERIDALCEAQKWDQATSETQRLVRRFEHNERIAGLPVRIDAKRSLFKRTLLKQYQESVQRQDVDRAHDLLFQLDSYLAPNEAAALKETARGVFKAKLQQMGVQFSLAVTERRFEDAIQIGAELIREFPNSRYAHEIEQMVPALRQRMQEHHLDSEPATA